MEAERSRALSEFQTTGAATWKLRRPNWVLIRGTSISRHSAERRCDRPVTSATGKQTCECGLGQCRRHSRHVVVWFSRTLSICAGLDLDLDKVVATSFEGRATGGILATVISNGEKVYVYVCVQIPLAAYATDACSRRSSRNRRSYATTHEDVCKMTSQSVAGKSRDQ